MPEKKVMPNPNEDFLNKIEQLESSGGVNLDHPEIESGIHAGSSAIGRYALMPNTIRELAQRVKRRDPKLKLDQGFQGDPDLERYSDPNLSDDEISQTYLSNPELEQRTAKYLQKLLETRYANDPEKMAYGWNMGHNTKPENITPDKLKSNPYVNRFRQLQNFIKNK